ncbi:MAG: redoxin domain-containing protein, partial [Ignavibacteriales bacterium]|nr:redoxin domain-containing protein [Ignavibacteriales bacterium]
MLKEKSKAPNFTLLDENNNKISLKDFLGQKVILYFYPKDNTS